MSTTELPAAGNLVRERCYGCYRPLGGCFCHEIPRIQNATEVLIVQHVRERFHAFNTARIVRRALTNSSLFVTHAGPAALPLPLKPGAGLLYPGPGAIPLEDLPAAERPSQLVVLDGTWHHAKTFVRDVPALRSLPRYGLAPTEPGRYRIRREPNAMALSTVEATVAALKLLEPNTAGLDQLVAAFTSMVDRQLAHPKAEYGWRKNERRSGTSVNIPLSLVNDLANVVVIYGETTAGRTGQVRAACPPLYWVAQRIGTGETFACTLAPQVPLEDTLLRYLELSREDFAGALSLAAAREAWKCFLRPSDVLAAYTVSSARLQRTLTGHADPCLILKSVDFNPLQKYGTLDELVQAERLTVSPARLPGRAGKRLAQTIAVAEHLQCLGVVRGVQPLSG